jgi:hypothetical protein
VSLSYRFNRSISSEIRKTGEHKKKMAADLLEFTHSSRLMINSVSYIYYIDISSAG